MTYSSDCLSIQRGLDVPLGDQARNQVSGDDASLGVGGKEDGVSPTKVVDPSRIRQV
jgi:hypothetical protein